jgi:hypothetical protein
LIRFPGGDDPNEQVTRGVDHNEYPVVDPPQQQVPILTLVPAGVSSDQSIGIDKGLYDTGEIKPSIRKT